MLIFGLPVAPSSKQKVCLESKSLKMQIILEKVTVTWGGGHTQFTILTHHIQVRQNRWFEVRQMLGFGETPGYHAFCDIRVRGRMSICMALWTIISHAKLVPCLPLKIITTITHSPNVQHGRWKQQISIKKGISCCKWSLSVDFEGMLDNWSDIYHMIWEVCTTSVSFPLLSLGVLNTDDKNSTTITAPPP